MLYAKLTWWERPLDLLALVLGGSRGYRITVWLLERAERRRCSRCGA